MVFSPIARLDIYRTMNIGNRVLQALGAAAAILLVAAIASAQEAAPPAPTQGDTIETSSAPSSAEIWARYQECETQLKPVEQSEFQRLSPSLRAAFLDAHCGDAKTEAAPAPETESKKIIAVARFEDRDGAMKDEAMLAALDTTLWSTFAGRKQSSYQIVRLDPPAPGCGRKCAVDAAAAASAAFLVRGETQWTAGKHFAQIEIVSVVTGAVVHTRRSEFVLEAAFLVESTSEAISRAADYLFAEVAAPTKPNAVKKPIIAIAHLENAVPNLQDPDLFYELDDALYSAIAGLGQTRYQIGRLPIPEGPCHLPCAVGAAKAAGASYVLWSAIEREGDRVRIVASLASASTGSSVRDSRSMWVTELRELKHGADQVSRDMVGVLVMSTTPVSQSRSGTWTPGVAGKEADVAGAMAAYRQKTIDSLEFAKARSQRNAGVALFILGIVLDSVGGGLVGAGLPSGNTGLVVGGAVASGAGAIMFFSGLGVWVSNQIRMNKMERGIPLARSLRLDGLSPIVASRDFGAPGLSARFSF
jgi:hypothetical protein